MKKKAISLLLVLAMLLSLVPTVALAEETPHEHSYIDGLCSCGEHNGDYTNWTPWGDNEAEKTSLPNTAGNYYLTADVTLTAQWQVPKDGTKVTNLCLNGYVISQGSTAARVICVNNHTTLNLYDCNGTDQKHYFSVGQDGLWTLKKDVGEPASFKNFNDLTTRPNTNDTVAVSGGCITGGVKNNKGCGVGVLPGSTFNMYGGSIVGNKSTKSKASTLQGGGGVALFASGTDDQDGTATFNMYGGRIIGNIAYDGNGGGVYAAEGTKFTMSGDSVIAYNASRVKSGGGVYLEKTVTFKMDNGEIKTNSSGNYGGGVYLTGSSTFTMNNGKINNNISSSAGGGVYLTGSSTFTMNNGEVKNNSTNSSGGGVCANAKFIMTNGDIANNKAGSRGGGVRITGDGSFAMTGGSVKSNTATASGGGIDAEGAITLGGNAVITNNKIGEKENNLYLYENKTLTFSEDKPPEDGMNVNVTVEKYGLITAPKEIEDDFKKYVFSDNSAVKLVSCNDRIYAVASAWSALNAALGCIETFDTANLSDTVLAGYSSCFTINPETDKVTLLKDITATEKDLTLTVPAGSKVTLDLNGHVLNADGKTGSVIVVSGNLTLKDSDPTVEHKGNLEKPDDFDSEVWRFSGNNSGSTIIKGGIITGGRGTVFGLAYEVYPISGGGGVFVDGGGTFTMERGTIAGNCACYGGGVYVNNGGSFTMKNGECSYNAASPLVANGWFCGGGGVFVDGGTFAMENGTIKNNTSLKGGGVYLENGGLCTIGGGVISDNKTIAGSRTEGGPGGGVWAESGSLKIMGNTVIEKNRAYTDGGGIGVKSGSLIMDGGSVTENYAGGSSTLVAGYSYGCGGGICVSNDAVFTMKNGVVSKNEAYLQGGGISSNGEFHILGGEISNNRAGIDGGAIHTGSNEKSVVSSIKDCTIRNNTATNGNGGAIHLQKGNSGHDLSITGGLITGNSATGTGDGIDVGQDCKLILGGAVQIFDNAEQNVYLPTNQKITLCTEAGNDKWLQNEGIEPPAPGMSVGVFLGEWPSDGESVAFTETASAASDELARYFFPDKEGYYVSCGNDQLSIVKPQVTFAINTVALNCSMTVADADGNPVFSAAENDVLTLTVTPNEDCNSEARTLEATYHAGQPQTCELTRDAQNPTKYTFIMPAYPVTIKAEFDVLTKTVTFDMQGFGTQIDPISGVVIGRTISAPTAPVAENRTFGGWFKDKECTTAWNFGTDVVTKDVTLYAKWIQNDTSMATISGTVTQGDKVVPNARVELCLGTVTVAATETDIRGNYSFSSVESGIYNIVVTTADTQKTTTKLLVVVTGSTGQTVDVTLPESSVSSVVDVSDTHEVSGMRSDIKHIVVGGLDEIAEALTASGEKIEIKLVAEPKAVADVATTQAIAIQNEAGSNKRVEFFDMTLTKKVGENSPEPISDTGTKLVEVVFPFDFAGVDVNSVVVLRYHGNAAAALPKLTAVPTDEEGYIVNIEANTITIYSKLFSTYAIGYRNDTDPVNPPSSGGGGGVSAYAITGADTENGKLTVSSKSAAAGKTITVTVTPDAGYKLDTLTAKDANGNAVTLAKQSDTTYTFKMPSSKVTVSATFAKDGVCPQDASCVYAKFTDADTKAWYHDGVHFCVEKGYMNGVSDTEFAPSGTLSRAMIVTMLWRMEGEPVVDYAMSFKDVESGQWYAEAIRWAQSTKVVTGYDADSFGPEDSVTREQLAAILYRYADYKGIDVSERADLSRFDDANAISSWALENVKWANAVGIMGGRTADTIASTGGATRAEAANMVQRFCETVMK